MAIVSVKSRGGWTEGGKFSLGVSMGSENHDGEALQAVVDWINASSFESGIIDLSDTLCRFGFMLEGLYEESAYLASVKLGDEWLRRNSSILSSLEKPCQVIRWDTWRRHEDFESVSAEVEAAYKKSTALRHAVYADISAYYTRKDIALSPEKVGLSTRYFLEELTAHTLLHRIHDVAAIYPGKQLECYKMVRQKKVEFPEGIPGSAFVRLVPHSFANTPQFLPLVASSQG